MRLDGKVVVVTGASSGIGQALAVGCAREGADLAITYRGNEAGARETAARIGALGRRAQVTRVDISRDADVEALARTVEAEFGHVDVAVANAGGDLLRRPLEKLTQAEWHKVVDAELDGLLFLAKAVLPGMRKRRWGRIVTIGWDRAPSPSALPYDYAVGKAARDLLAQKLARAEQGTGVTVNTVAPGAIPYPSDAASRQLVRHGKAWTARTRSWNQDVAEQVLWLCREETRFVTGSRIEVHGEPG